MKTTLVSLVTLTLLNTTIQANFNFNECAGSGTFEQQIHRFVNYEDSSLVGNIPEGIEGLEISLSSDKDVDIRLYGENDDKVVHWPYGIHNQSMQKTKPYKTVPVTYSGYNGVDGEKGHEFIKVEGTTPTTMTMKAFGYKAGYATVNYSWKGKTGCTPQDSGSGSFTQTIENKATSLVGTIPPGVENVQINLTSDKDLDIQLFAQDGTAIASWKPAGLMADSAVQNTLYEDMNITWSGYNGVDGQRGHEYITISNTTTQMLVLKVYGYEAGVADVTYSWGENVEDNIKIVDDITTLQNALESAKPRHIIRIKKGTYKGQLVLKKSGEENNPITIESYGDGPVIIDGSSSEVIAEMNDTWNGLIYMDDVRYIRLSGIEIHNSSRRGILLNHTEYIEITNVKTYNTNSSGIGVSESNHTLIDNNEVELACNGGQEESISIVQSSDVNVTNNEVHHNGGGENGGEGIDVKEGSHDVNVINNHVHHIYSCFGTGRPGIYADAWNKETYNIVISNNNVHDVQAQAFSLGNECGGDLYDVKITNNMAYNNKGEAILIGGWTNQDCVEANETGNTKIVIKDGNETKYVENPIRNVNIANNSFYISSYPIENNSFCANYVDIYDDLSDNYGGIYIDNKYPKDINITDNIIQSDENRENNSIDGNGSIVISKEDLNITNNILYNVPNSIYQENFSNNLFENTPCDDPILSCEIFGKFY